MQIELDTMYQNISIKAILRSGVSFIDGNSGAGKSFFFEMLKDLASQHKFTCCHIKASDGIVAGFLEPVNEIERKQCYDALVTSMSAVKVLTISSADIFVTKEMLREVLSRRPDSIILLETKEAPSYYYLRPTPLWIRQIKYQNGSLTLSEGVSV